MTSLVTGPSGDSGALPNQAINGCQTSTPAPLVILLLCIPLSPLPSSPHSYSCWEHRPRLFPTSPARHHGESVFHPSPVLRSPFQEQSALHCRIGKSFTLAPVYEYLLCPASCIPNSSSSLSSLPPLLLFLPSTASQNIGKIQLVSASGRPPLAQVRIVLCPVTTVG